MSLYLKLTSLTAEFKQVPNILLSLKFGSFVLAYK